MRAFLECIPCFMRQTLGAGRLMGLPEETIKDLMDIIGEGLKDVSLDTPPPDMARQLQALINARIGEVDPYHDLKKESNAKALEYYDMMSGLVAQSEDKLKAALQVAIAGNIIDYGAIHDLDAAAELKALMNEERLQIEREESENFAYQAFRNDLDKARTLVYVGDNAGEIVFDKILISTIRELYPELKITFATRGKPILNDCLLEDAHQIGLDELVTVVSSGSDAPGMLIDRCSEEYLKEFFAADMIISKGQGNYESLSEVEAPIYFLLIAKCDIVARDLACNYRDIILKKAASQK